MSPVVVTTMLLSHCWQFKQETSFVDCLAGSFIWRRVQVDFWSRPGNQSPVRRKFWSQHPPYWWTSNIQLFIKLLTPLLDRFLFLNLGWKKTVSLEAFHLPGPWYQTASHWMTSDNRHVLYSSGGFPMWKCWEPRYFSAPGQLQAAPWPGTTKVCSWHRVPALCLSAFMQDYQSDWSRSCLVAPILIGHLLGTLCTNQHMRWGTEDLGFSVSVGATL